MRRRTGIVNAILVARQVGVAAVFLAGSTALAQTWDGGDAVDSTDWNAAANWNPDAVPTGVNVLFPVAGSIVDLKGTSPNVLRFQPTANSQVFTNTSGGTITCTDFYNKSKSGENNVYPDLNATTRIYYERKYTTHNKFHGTVTTPLIDTVATVSFYGPVVGTADPFPLAWRDSGTGQNTTFNFFDTITTPGDVTLGSSSTYSAILSLQGAGALGGIGGALQVNSGGVLDLVAAPTAFPSGSVVINQYGLLLGDTGAVTWGPTSNINVTTDAILATSAGTMPTAANIGQGVCWKGVMTDALTEAGNDGVGIYKGLAIGSFNTQIHGATLQSPAGAGDVEIFVLPGFASTSVESVTYVSVDGTGTANFYCAGPFGGKGGAFLGAIINLNFIGQAGAITQFINMYNGFNVAATQTLNFSGAGIIFVEPDNNMMGKLTFSDDTMYRATTEVFQDNTTHPDVSLTFNDGTALSIGNGEEDLLENLDFATQIVMNGTPILALETGGSNVEAVFSPQFDITAIAQPNLFAFMKKANISVGGGNGNYADLMGDGLIVGDGKYLLSYSDSHKGLFLRGGTNTASISAVGGVGTTMGIACLSGDNNDYLHIIIPVDGNGATLRLQNDVEMTVALKGNNKRYTGIPNRNFYMEGPIEDTPEIDVRYATVHFEPGMTVPSDVMLMVQSNATVDLNTFVTVGVVGGNGEVDDPTGTNLVFDTVAPGLTNGCGNLTLGAFNMLNGATYEWGVADPLGTPGTGYDVISGTATFDTAWTLQLTDGGFTGTLDGTEIFTIITGTSTPTAFIAPTITAPGTGYKVSGASVYLSGNNVMLKGVTGVAAASPSGTVFFIK